jgi:hypothetical protein
VEKVSNVVMSASIGRRGGGLPLSGRGCSARVLGTNEQSRKSIDHSNECF